MSSTRTRQETPSTSNVQLFIDALADYAKLTGIDLSNNPFAATLEHSDFPEAIRRLLQEREKAFKEYRDDNRRLISCLSPAMNVLQAFSGILGEVASLAPFPPANALLAGIDALLAAASGVTSSYDAVLDLFECLGSFLKRLEIYTAIPPTPIMTDIIVKILIELLSVLALATKQINQGRFKKFAKKLLGDSEVEAILQRLDRLTQDEARVTVAQTLGVVHGLVGNMKIIMEDGKASADGIQQDLVAIRHILNELKKAKHDQLLPDIQGWLTPPDPSTNHIFVSEARHSETAAWFFEGPALKKWKTSGSLLWIHGKPGAGKSTLLSAIIQDIEGKHSIGLAKMAYYYFDFRDSKKQDCYGLLSSLVLQLAAESDSCYNILSQLYSDHSRGVRKPTINALKKCIKDMLSLPGHGPIYIIVDALDECPNFPSTPSAREKVLELIEELVDLKLSNVHLCVASRPEIDIRVVLEPLTSLHISLHDESGQKADIITYIKSVVRSDRRMRRWRDEDQNLVVGTLSRNADGMFRWVVCQVDRLRRSFPASIRSALADLPEDLDQTYEQTLLGIDKQKRKYAQRLFQCLWVTLRPLRVEELAEIFAVQFDANASPLFDEGFRPLDAEEAVLSACSSLVAVVDREGGKVVQFSHFSVKEFLTSERLATAEERLSYYHILPESAHTILAHASLSVLLQLDDNIDKNTIKRFPLVPYAGRHWVDHAQYKCVSLHVQEVMGRLFDPTRSHFAAWVWLHDIDRPWMEPMATVHPTQPAAMPLYYASLCGFRGIVEHLIALHPPDINSRGGYHTTALHAASIKGHFGVATLLLINGADPNSLDNQDRVPLHRVSQGGQLVMAESSLEIARLLLNSGAKVNVADNKGWTPLHTAARSGYREIVELLLESGAILDVQSSSQETPLHVASLYGKLDVSRFLINRGSDINSRDEKGFIPLHSASRYGHLNIVQLLLDRGCDANERQREGWSPLHNASQYGYLDLARLLINRGADVKSQTTNRWTPLHLASDKGHLDIAKLLVERGADANSRNDKQETPLGRASENGYLEIARFLIESGAAVSARDEMGWTPFHRASKRGHLHIMKFLLECGVPVDIRNGSEETSLDLASASGKTNVVRFLIEHGADIDVKDEKGWNPLHHASQNAHPEVVRLLIDSGATVDIRNGIQQTPLALASGKGKVEVGRFLIERGADINAQDNQGCAPLHLAARHGHLDMARMLLNHGADANVQKDDLWSPLHLASHKGNLKVADLLIQRGASIDLVNDKQETPLYRAIWNGKLAISRLLIDHGANLHTADGNGWTLLHAASYSGHLEVVKLLLRQGVDVNALNKANKTAGELALENDRSGVAEFIAEYRAGTDIRN